MGVRPLYRDEEGGGVTMVSLEAKLVLLSHRCDKFGLAFVFDVGLDPCFLLQATYADLPGHDRRRKEWQGCPANEETLHGIVDSAIKWRGD